MYARMLTLIEADGLRADPWAPLQRPGRVLIDDAGGSIVRVGVDAAPVVPSVTTTRFEGILAPALIDTHVHLTGLGTNLDPVSYVEASDQALTARGLHGAARALETGVATLADQGGRGNVLLAIRRRAATTSALPDLLVAGPPITTRRGHMWGFGGEAAGPEEVRELAERWVAAGVDLLKVVASGGGTPGTDPFAATFQTAELQIIVSAARRAGLPTAAHASSAISIRRAVDAGVSVIHHCNFFDPAGSRKFDRALADAVAEAGAHVDPTLWVTRGLFDGPAQVEVSERERDRAKRYYDGKLGDVRGLIDAGVTLVAGSDSGWKHSQHGETWREVVALADAGLSVRDALAAATVKAAVAIGRTDRGRIASGCRADLVVLERDPVEDLAVLGRPRAVITAGAVAWRAGDVAGSVGPEPRVEDIP